MTKQQALEVLDQLAAQYKGTRQEHVTLQQALQVLREPEVAEKPKGKK